MNADNIRRRLRGALGNALVWGAGWAALGAAVFAGLKVAGILSPEVLWIDSIMVAGRLGFMGGVAGGAFSAVIGLLYRGRRLSGISALRFGVRGGMVAGLFVPAFMQTMSLLSGGGLVPMRHIGDDILLATLFGGVAAGVSLKLAQRAQTTLSGTRPDRPGLLESGDRPAGDGRDLRRHKAPAWRSAGD
jgi:hypothetical protein